MVGYLHFSICTYIRLLTSIILRNKRNKSDHSSIRSFARLACKCNGLEIYAAINFYFIFLFFPPCLHPSIRIILHVDGEIDG